MSIQAMKQALEALERIGMKDWVERKEEAITSLRQAIAEAEKQEPNGYLWFTHHMEQRFTHYKPRQEQMIGEARPVYTHPQPKREWVGLTPEEKVEAAKPYYGVYGFRVEEFAAALEAKLKEKNT